MEGEGAARGYPRLKGPAPGLPEYYFFQTVFAWACGPWPEARTPGPGHPGARGLGPGPGARGDRGPRPGAAETICYHLGYINHNPRLSTYWIG